VWQKAHRLTLEVYSLSATLAAAKHFAVSDQLIRSAMSVPANLAEGCGRKGDRELRRFVRVSLGSASELEYHLLLVRDLGLLAEERYDQLAGAAMEVKRMLSGLASRLTERIDNDDG
jgi:four helix bundle protein